MDADLKREFTARIAQANRSELVVILFEMFAYCLDMSEKFFGDNDSEKGVYYIKQAQGCLCELRGSLDFKYPISVNLAELYSFVNVKLAAGMAKRKPVEFTAIRDVMGGLQDSFSKIAKEDNTKPVMENTQKLYAGLTYGRGTLNEVITSGNEPSRGFKA